MYLAKIFHHCSNLALHFIWGIQEQLSHCCFDHYTTDNCCELYTQGAIILGRNFRVLSNKQYFLTSLEICHLLSHLSGVRFPLSKGKQEFQIRTRADAFPTRYIKKTFHVKCCNELGELQHSAQRKKTFRVNRESNTDGRLFASLFHISSSAKWEPQKMLGQGEGHGVH